MLYNHPIIVNKKCSECSEKVSRAKEKDVALLRDSSGWKLRKNPTPPGESLGYIPRYLRRGISFLFAAEEFRELEAFPVEEAKVTELQFGDYKECHE
jgi:hypothetical protein